MLTRRSILKTSALLALSPMLKAQPGTGRRTGPSKVITVTGPVDQARLGHALIHEHCLVDFTPAADYDQNRWNDGDVVEKVAPILIEARQSGCSTFFDCTPNYVGRDAVLLKKLSEAAGLNIVTTTGYYGGSNEKALPAQAFTETEEQLAKRWIDEAKNGIDGTAIKPGMIKISVNDGLLTDISKKLVRAAALAHQATGLAIVSHTGTAIPAFEQIGILKSMGVSPGALVWTHAQREKDLGRFLDAAREGAWISLDGVDEDSVDRYVRLLLHMKKNNALNRTLVSHDAGWYQPEKPGGGKIRGFTALFVRLIPALRRAGFEDRDIRQLLNQNPWDAYSIPIWSV